MITFCTSDSFKEVFRPYQKLLFNVYDYFQNIFADPLQYSTTVHFDLIKNQHELHDFDAYTIIEQWTSEKYPLKSIIYVTTEFCSRKHFYYTLIHEMLHALGLMYVPALNTRWNKMIDMKNNIYIGPKNRYSIAIHHYLDKKHTCIPLDVCSNHSNTKSTTNTMTDYHHLTANICDVFSSPLHYNITPITLGLLSDYGYELKSDDIL
jgi:hypothetical protein